MAIISLTAEYALRAVVHLAGSGDDLSQTVGQIAEGTRVPSSYLAKVLQSLVRAEVILSQRGLGGGFRLSKTAAEISIYEVIQAVDPLERIRECPLGLEAHGTDLCPLHKRLDDAIALIETQFRNTTISELLPPPAKRAFVNRDKLCVFPLTSVDKTDKNNAMCDSFLQKWVSFRAKCDDQSRVAEESGRFSRADKIPRLRFLAETRKLRSE